MISYQAAKAIACTLERFSPEGLCGGTLILKNGSPQTTIGCAIGALVAGMLWDDKELDKKLTEERRSSTPPGCNCSRCVQQRQEASIIKVMEATHQGSLPYSVSGALETYYGITERDITVIMGYNDAITVDDEGKVDAPPPDWAPSLPALVKETIVKLRKQYLTTEHPSIGLGAQGGK